jgi:hypothetical protein
LDIPVLQELWYGWTLKPDFYIYFYQTEYYQPGTIHCFIQLRLELKSSRYYMRQLWNRSREIVFQYSNQRDNLGINSRLQWRFAPLSDLFIVYNDNYSVNTTEPKFRSIDLKLSYWLNI